jgi:hypothetical protein
LINGFNTLREMGTVGTVFHACCLLETTTIRFLIRTVPIVPNEGFRPVGRMVPQNTHNTQNSGDPHKFNSGEFAPTSAAR